MEKNESHAEISNGNSNENGEAGSAKNNSARKTAKQRRFQKDTIIYGIPVKNAAKLDQSQTAPMVTTSVDMMNSQFKRMESSTCNALILDPDTKFISLW